MFSTFNLLEKNFSVGKTLLCNIRFIHVKSVFTHLYRFTYIFIHSCTFIYLFVSRLRHYNHFFFTIPSVFSESPFQKGIKWFLFVWLKEMVYVIPFKRPNSHILHVWVYMSFEIPKSNTGSVKFYNILIIKVLTTWFLPNISNFFWTTMSIKSF